MGLMQRQTLARLAKVARKMDYHPSRQEVITLVDHGLAALDEIDGGKSTIELRAELKERERQVKLALLDLGEALQTERNLEKGIYIAHLIMQMLNAKGTKWHNEWSWYQPRVEEEFGE